ncbi:hypothetical protein OG761_02265 [Streptomyces tubercidicus]|nr:hypothetical protein OG761_02265 [Streptomyces tubercidicus]WSX24603.1 hypothetical protein OG690_35570 [Streptomyces tubercidicus]
MEAKNGHLIEGADGVSVAVLDGDVDGAGVTSKATTLSREAAAAHGLSPRLLDELAELAEVKVRDGGLKLMGAACCLSSPGISCRPPSRRRWTSIWARRPATPVAGALVLAATPATAIGPGRS